MKKDIVDSLSSTDIQSKSLWQHAFERLKRNKAAMASLFILISMGILVVIGPLLSPHAFDKIYWDAFSTPPSLMKAHFFGTDSSGRDLFVRVLVGGRLSLLIGLIST